MIATMYLLGLVKNGGVIRCQSWLDLERFGRKRLDYPRDKVKGVNALRLCDHHTSTRGEGE